MTDADEGLTTLAQAVAAPPTADAEKWCAPDLCGEVIVTVHLDVYADDESMRQAVAMLTDLRRAGAIRGGMVVPADWQVDITRI